MKIFMTGASGYIGGSVAASLIKAGHYVMGLVRSDERARQLEARGIVPVPGSLADADVLRAAARGADAVINAANSDNWDAVDALLEALAGTGKAFIQTSGTSIVADLADGEHEGKVYDESTPVSPLPLRAGRVAVNDAVLAAAKRGVRAIVLCPSLIYGMGRGVHRDSMQVPRLIELARKYRVGRHVGPGRNIWSNVHIDDLVTLYLLALEKAPAGAFYYVENGENSMRDMAAAIGAMLGYGERTEPMTVKEAVEEWGEGPARYSMASNSRVRAVRARQELGWSPSAASLPHEIRRGCYAGQGPRSGPDLS
jgi:nucleoside-diphosphate-sugar epimerase